jgi:putative heme-binding domain-containing protein
VLGNDFKHETLLKLTGDATRGKALFAAVCAACHRAKGEGVDFGPDLSAVAKKWNRAGLIEQLLFPSKVIEPQWMLTTVELTNGESKSGFVTAQQAGELTLKMAGGETARVPAKQVKQTRSERVSLMPEGMLQALTAAEAADLLAFMGTLQ